MNQPKSSMESSPDLPAAGGHLHYMVK